MGLKENKKGDMPKKQKTIKCEICEEEITKESMSENHSNRCRDCFEEWGDLWPDQV